MRKLLRAVHDRLGLRGWVALCLILAVLASVLALAPRILRSRFLAERRTALILRRAEAHMGARELNEARRDFSTVLRLQPDNARARHRLALLDLSLGDWELAFLEFQSLAEMHPEDPNGWIGLADIMVKSGLLSTPEAALDNAIAADPRRADAHRIRGDIRFRMGRYFGALVDAEAAVAEAPKDAASWGLLVRSASRSRGEDAGIEAARRGIAAIGQDPAVVHPLAWLLAERGRIHDAVEMLQEAIHAHADSTARLTLARVELRAGDPEGARKRLDAVLAESPVDEEALALRAVIDAASGRVEAALQQLEGALQLLPSSRLLHELQGGLQAAHSDRAAVDALVAETMGRDLGPSPAPWARVRAEARRGTADQDALGREHWPGRLAKIRQDLDVQLRRQNWTTAERIVEYAGKNYPDSAFDAFLKGILELARGNTDKAEKQLSASLAVAPRSPVILSALAKTWSREKGAGFAGSQLMQLADRDPQFEFARYLAARAYLDGREPAQAEEALQRGLQRQPDSAVPYRQLASFYVDLDRPADAASICQQGLDRFPQDLPLQMTLAQLSADLGKPADAIRIYEGVLSRRPNLDLVEYKLATLVASQEKDAASSPRSRQILQDLRSDQPSDPLLLDALGWVHASAGATGRARELLEAAVKAAPDEPSPHFHLAAIYARERKADLARNELRAAVESGRPFPERLDAMRLLREDTSTLTPKRSAGVSPPAQ
jgi:tetratricopeptide (TPR) repeat protein